MPLEQSYVADPPPDAQAKVEAIVRDFLAAYEVAENSFIAVRYLEQETANERLVRVLTGVTAHLVGCATTDTNDGDRLDAILQGIGGGIGSTLVEADMGTAMQVAARLAEAVIHGREGFRDALSGKMKDTGR